MTSLPTILGLQVRIVPHIPPELIGHEFSPVPFSRHRSKRLWKKLRYGRRREKVRFIFHFPIFSSDNFLVLSKETFEHVVNKIKRGEIA